MIPMCRNHSISHVWVNHGINPCFSEIVGPSGITGFILVFGLIQLSLYGKYSTRIERGLRGKPKLFTLQVMLHAALPLLSIATLLVYIFRLQDSKVYISQILSACFQCLFWTLSLGLIFLERRKQLPVSPTRGHGIVLLAAWTLALISVHLPFISYWSDDYWWSLKTYDDNLRFGLWLSCYILTLFTFIIGLKAPALSINQYNNLRTEDNQPQSQRSTWKGLFTKLKMIAPLVWPKGHIGLQILVILCAMLLVAGRISNLYVPLYYKKIVDSLTTDRAFCVEYILIWAGLRFLQGSLGVISNLRTFMWINVSLYTTKQTELKLFSHLHSLSLRWHLSKKTGEVLRVMDRGTASVNSILNYVVFSILPAIADILIAIVYFITAFDFYFGLIILATMTLYLIATILVTEWRTKYRRGMNLLDNAKNSKAVDSLVNFETVKYYGNADYEVENFSHAIDELQSMNWKSQASLNLLNLTQKCIITGGLVAGALLCAWYIHDGNQIKHRAVTVGDFVLFCTYLLQLYGPLNFFGTYYRMIQNSFIDMENMFDLLTEQQEVKDKDDSVNIKVENGSIEFKNVHFHYEPAKPVLRGISFKVPAGQTYALVGSSGAGKSSVIRLLFRFYDIQEGQILIDGFDIAQVKQESLRKSVGIVPQDTVLFNTDIKYNIGYGNTKAEKEQIEESARAADIHDRILSFPDGYETIVGERGLKLSGGEKQRVAIARTLLKNPKVILLDEATSALDTHTERNILRSFDEVCANRTTLVVAHRLSTIIHAHQILVLEEGLIAECGTHEELLEKGGIYCNMWESQQRKKGDDGEAETSDQSTNHGEDSEPDKED